MEEMKEDLLSKDVSIYVSESEGVVMLDREKGIDQEYFQMITQFKSDKESILYITLQLKGSIDGEDKDLITYRVTPNDSIVEDEYDVSDIREIASILKELDYSDKEFVSFIK